MPQAAKSNDVSTKADAEVATTTKIRSAIEHGDGVESGTPGDVKNASIGQSASLPETVGQSRQTPPDEAATSTERESSSSSDVPDDAQDAVNEQSDSHQESVVDAPESEEILSPVESSEDDAVQVPASARELPATHSKKSKRKPAATTAASADSSPATPQIETELLSTHEPVSAPLVEKKHAAKEHRKEKSKKDKAEKKKPTRGKKDKKGASLISKAADTVGGSSSESQDKILEDLATRGPRYLLGSGRGCAREARLQLQLD